MNKTELIEKVSSITGMTKAAAGRTVDAIIETITLSLKKNDQVSLIGFGTFVVRKRSARMGRNPKTKELIQIKSAKVPGFRAGRHLKLALN